MKKSFFTLLLAVLFISGVQAKPVDMQTAKFLGEKFLKANTEIKSVTTELTYTVYADNGSAVPKRSPTVFSRSLRIIRLDSAK